MERLAELIGKLKEQFEQNADKGQLLVITQMIQVELLNAAERAATSKSTSKVSVLMPASHKAYVPVSDDNDSVELPAQQPITTKAETPAKPAEAPPRPTPQPQPTQAKTEPAVRPAPPVTSTPSFDTPPVKQPVAANESVWSIDPLQDVPTLAQQQHGKEINDMMAGKDNSLNDKLKAPVVEVGHRLTDSPIRDLKKGIGVNDRYVFISELFRGDEVMYERSIKTINGFRIFAEAEYWIERELKVKLGWEEDKPATRHFYQLVKRRFS
ncbi:MAG TPA: hypothetical protein VLC28_05605 [Flavitalea sp.]|nr:hypothetical protein [Flavitalea sp.]